MSEQLSLDGLAEGRARRDEALAYYSSTRFVEECRRTAFAIAKKKGWVTSDDIRDEHEIPEAVNHNAMGAVLRAPYFVKIGEVQSRRPEAKARWIHKWAIGPAWRKYL